MYENGKRKCNGCKCWREEEKFKNERGESLKSCGKCRNRYLILKNKEVILSNKNLLEKISKRLDVEDDCDITCELLMDLLVIVSRKFDSYGGCVYIGDKTGKIVPWYTGDHMAIKLVGIPPKLTIQFL